MRSCLVVGQQHILNAKFFIPNVFQSNLRALGAIVTLHDLLNTRIQHDISQQSAAGRLRRCVMNNRLPTVERVFASGSRKLF